MSLKEVVGPDLPTSDGTAPAEPPQQRAPEPAITEPAEGFTPEPPEGGADDDKFTVGAPETPPKDDDPPEPGEPAKPTRKARRTQRYDELQQRATAAETAAQEANARAARMEGMLQAFQTMQQQPQQSQDPPKNPEDEAYEAATAIADQMDNLTRSMQSRMDKDGKLDPKYEAEYRKQYNKLQFDYHRAVAKSVQPQPQGQQSPEQARGEAIRAQIEAQFPDVVNHPQAGQFARGQYDQLTAMGHPPGMQTLQWAWHAARAQFGQAPPPQPNGQSHPQLPPQQYPQAAPPPPPPPQYGGYPQAGYPPPNGYPPPPPSYMPPGAAGRMVGAPPGSGNPDAAGPVEVRMTPDMKKMADHAFGHIKDPKQRYQYYVNNVVKPHLIRMRQTQGQ